MRIITDSASDLTTKDAQRLGIEILPLKVCFGNEEFLDGIDLDHDSFFEKLIETDIVPVTSQISPFDYGMKFKEYDLNQEELIVITLSSKLSGCYQSAWVAAQEQEDRIHVVDSENVCIGERILVEYACRLRDEGKTALEIVEELDRAKKRIRLVALVDTLEYLKKGGRISAAAAIAGNLLSIKPVISVINGEIAVVGKARGSKAGNNKLSELVEKEGAIRFDMPLCLAYSGLSDYVLRKYMKDFSYLYEGHVDELPISSVGCTIGTHIGPGAIAVAFFV